jgi:hypothetical protein
LSWTDGERVEGYSNLLWILTIAFVGLFDVELVRAARFLGLAFSSLTLATLLFYALRWKSLRECGWSLAIAGVCLASAAPMGAWSIGGLEQPLVALGLAVLLASCLSLSRADGNGARILCWISSAALVLTRPDGVLLVGAVAAAMALFARGSIPLRGQLLLWLPAGSALAGHEFFRWSYYGDWLPNTARIKFTPSGAHLAHGWNYLRWGLRALLPFSAVAGAALLFLWRGRASRPAAAILTMPLVAWMAYLVLIGGDIFPAWRHIVPVMVLLAFALVEAQLREVRLPGFMRSRRVAALAGILIVIGFSFVQQADRENRRTHDERWEWFGKEIGQALRLGFHDARPLIAVSAAGCIPFWSKLPAIDMLGLNDAHIARMASPRAGSGYLGHEFGDGDYVLRRSPEIVCFGVGSVEPGFRSGLELWASPRFHTEFQPVRLGLMKPQPFTATLYMRKQSDKVGVGVEQGQLRIPAYLFAGGGGACVYAASDGVWELELEPGASADLALEFVGVAGWRPLVQEGWSLKTVEHAPGLLLRLENLDATRRRFREFRLAPAG